MFLLWLLSELFEQFPEAGDVKKPKLVFFFDEAHLLFNDTPKILEDKIVQVVRLIRSKGIGVYFVTQNPLDLPDAVLGQLGNRVHHALRAFTPRDAKNVKGAAGTLRPNPAFDTAKVMTELGIGEVLISMLDEKGSPSAVERALVYPPHSRLAPLSSGERAELIAASPLGSVYSRTIDRQSAYELLKMRAETVNPATRTVPGPEPTAGNQRPGSRSPAKGIGDVLGSAATSAARSAGTQLGRALIRGVLGSLSGKR
jgi:DNA helicase HerA-like ATPase